jgi:uncharacterized protein with PIN domain
VNLYRKVHGTNDGLWSTQIAKMTEEQLDWAIAFLQKLDQEKPKCPRCGARLVGLYFMSDYSVPPDFLICRNCHVAYDPQTLKPLANVIF